MVAAYVHGVAVRTPHPAVEPGGTKIHFFADYGGIVVVVSGDRVCPERQFLVYNELAGIGLVEVEFIPVEFVGEVAEVHHIDRPLGFRGFLFDERHHLLFEPGNIVPAGIVAQMYVREKEHSVIVLVFAHQFEVVSFHLVWCGFQKGPEARPQAVGRFGYRAGRCCDEDHAVRLVAGDGIAAEAVGLDYFLTVADQHSGKGFPVQSDLAPDCCLSIGVACNYAQQGRCVNQYSFHNHLIVCFLPIWSSPRAVSLPPLCAGCRRP